MHRLLTLWRCAICSRGERHRDDEGRTIMQPPFSRLISAVALTWVCSLPAPIMAQTPDDDAANTRWQLDAMIHLQRMRAFHDKDTGAQPTPSTIPQRTMDADPSGIISSYQPNGDNADIQQCIFSKPWNQWAHMLHLPSGANRLVGQRPKCARQI